MSTGNKSKEGKVSELKAEKVSSANSKQGSGEQVHVEYSDGIFRKLFKEKRRAVELYRAASGGEELDPNEIEILKISGVFGEKMRGDIAFITKDKRLIVLCEQQSTINPNMPFRFLQYYAEYLKKVLKNDDKYKSKLLTLPEPRFYVFYNGKASYPLVKVLRLSDAFKRDSGDKREFQIELLVTVYNINYEQQGQILAQSRSLKEYSELIGEIRKIRVTSKLDFMREIVIVIDKFMAEGKLADFLHDNYEKVANMMTLKWDDERAREVMIEECVEERVEQRLAQRTEQILKQGLKKGHKQGLKKGLKQGRKDGILEAQLNSIRVLINKFKCSLEEAMESLEIPVAERATYRAALV